MAAVHSALLFAVASLALGYELAFTQATLRIGRSMSSDSSGRGLQDAELRIRCRRGQRVDMISWCLRSLASTAS